MLCASCDGYPRILDRMVTRKPESSRKPPRTPVVAVCESDISASHTLPSSRDRTTGKNSMMNAAYVDYTWITPIVTERLSSRRSNPSESHTISASEKSHADIARAYSSRPRASMAFRYGPRANLMLPSLQILFTADESNRSRQSILIPLPTGMACYGDMNTRRQANSGWVSTSKETVWSESSPSNENTVRAEPKSRKSSLQD